MTPVPVLLRRALPRLLLVALAAAAGTAIVVPRLPTGVDVVVPFTVPVPGRPASGDYEYDGFYALQATDLFAATLAGWLASPDVVATVYRRADLPEPARSVRRLGRVFAARKISGQLVELQFHAESADAAGRIAEETIAALEERVDRFNEDGGASLAFSVIAGEPLVVPVARSVPLRALVAAIVAFVVAANLLIVWDASRGAEED